jgi:hypothetical protein
MLCVKYNFVGNVVFLFQNKYLLQSISVVRPFQHEQNLIIMRGKKVRTIEIANKVLYCNFFFFFFFSKITHIVKRLYFFEYTAQYIYGTMNK